LVGLKNGDTVILASVGGGVVVWTTAYRRRPGRRRLEALSGVRPLLRCNCEMQLSGRPLWCRHCPLISATIALQEAPDAGRKIRFS
jgi:hypothetical protein